MRCNKLLLLFSLLCSTYLLRAQENSKTKQKVSRIKKPAKVSKYKLAQFDGRWQEVSRADSKTKEAVAISDTIYIRFYDGTKADTKEGASVVITGTADIDKNDDITTSARDFHIVSVTENEIILDDQTGQLHTFNRKNIFAYEIAAAPPAALKDEAPAVIDISPSSLNKNWFAYRRGANPGFIKSETPVIKGLLIKEKVSETVYTGDIEFSVRGVAVTKACVLTFKGHDLTITTEANSWTGEVYKADGQELIYGKKGELVYYFRPL